MASLRGGTTLYSGATVATGDVSKVAVVNADPYVTVYIETSADATFDIEVGYNSTGIEAGRNAFNDADLPDGGLDWFKYKTAVAITATTPTAIELSPFGPQYLRITRTDAGTAATVTAYVSSFGPN